MRFFGFLKIFLTAGIVLARYVPFEEYYTMIDDGQGSTYDPWQFLNILITEEIEKLDHTDPWQEASIEMAMKSVLKDFKTRTRNPREADSEEIKDPWQEQLTAMTSLIRDILSRPRLLAKRYSRSIEEAESTDPWKWIIQIVNSSSQQVKNRSALWTDLVKSINRSRRNTIELAEGEQEDMEVDDPWNNPLMDMAIQEIMSSLSPHSRTARYASRLPRISKGLFKETKLVQPRSMLGSELENCDMQQCINRSRQPGTLVCMEINEDVKAVTDAFGNPFSNFENKSYKCISVYAFNLLKEIKIVENKKVQIRISASRTDKCTLKYLKGNINTVEDTAIDTIDNLDQC